MNNIEITFQDQESFDTQQVSVFCIKVLNHFSLDNWEVSVLFCSENYISGLNKNYRDKKDPTDVLSFPQNEFIEKSDEHMYYAGDIVISLSYMDKNCDHFSVSQNEELKRLIIHGIMHLQGYDHKTNDTSEKMLQIQENLLLTMQGEKVI